VAGPSSPSRGRLAALAATALLLVPWGRPHAGDLGGFDCLIEPNAVVEVGTQEEGIIDNIAVRRGDFVSEGQVLVELDSEVQQANVDLAAARASMRGQLDAQRERVAHAQRRKKRTAELFAKKAGSFSEMDLAASDALVAELELRESEENVRVAQLALKRAEAELRRRRVISPIAGVVMSVRKERGEPIEGGAILELAELHPLKVQIIVPVEHFGAIQQGMEARVTPLYPGAVDQVAKVSVVDRVVDAASNTFRVQLELANDDYSIPGGVRCVIAFGS
jgi:RND family efflux transporter MFP subunit